MVAMILIDANHPNPKCPFCKRKLPGQISKRQYYWNEMPSFICKKCNSIFYYSLSSAVKITHDDSLKEYHSLDELLFITIISKYKNTRLTINLDYSNNQSQIICIRYNINLFIPGILKVNPTNLLYKLQKYLIFS